MSAIGINAASTVSFSRSRYLPSYSNLAANQTTKSSENSVANQQNEYQEIARFRQTLKQLTSTFRGALRSSSSSSPRPISSSAPLGLQQTATFSTLESSDEINATTRTEFTPTQPTFSGNSTSSPTIGGEYTGSTDDVLTFTVTNGGTVGGVLGILSSEQLEVRNQQGELVDTVSVPGLYSGAAIALSNGLNVSFSNGTLTAGDSFDVSVLANILNNVNPDNPFNGTGANAPGFESGVDVLSGSFRINEQLITVAADDSIRSVLARINSSSAEVTAAFDTNRERITLTSRVAGSSGNIQIDSDTSGFLSATRLDSINVVDGIDKDIHRALGAVAAFASVQSGTFGIDEQSFSIDRDSTTLQTVLDDINNNVDSMSIRYDENYDVVRISPSRSTRTLNLSDGDSGLLSALGFETGELEFAARRRGGLQSRKIREATRALATALNRLVKNVDSRTLENTLGSAFRQAITNTGTTSDNAAFGELQKLGFGVGGKDADFLTIDDKVLQTAVRQRGKSLQNLFRGRDSANPDGLLYKLDDALKDRLQELQLSMASRGAYAVDFIA